MRACIHALCYCTVHFFSQINIIRIEISHED
jgi:hypothetical protein